MSDEKNNKLLSTVTTLYRPFYNNRVIDFTTLLHVFTSRSSDGSAMAVEVQIVPKYQILRRILSCLCNGSFNRITVLEFNSQINSRKIE